MTGLDAALVMVLFFVMVIAMAAGGFLAARQPTFWINFGAAIFEAVVPKISEYVKKRNTPEVEAKMAECVRRGGQWDNFNKRCRAK